MDLIARANSDLTAVGMVVDRVEISAQQRMARILVIADDYRRATEPWKHLHRVEGSFWPSLLSARSTTEGDTDAS